MPHILATIPNTTTTKNTIAKTTTNTSLSRGSKADAPNVIIVVQINAKTPNGANFKILLIIQKTASNVPFKKDLTGSAFSPMAAKPKPKNTAKKMIGNNSPLVKASKKFVGTMFTMVSIKWLPYVDCSAACADD
ncbi:Uncharacterised protein [Streptococcus pneumoniae]|nr:Uncharacterised protein [Streptococcus pneumoniae]